MSSAGDSHLRHFLPKKKPLAWLNEQVSAIPGRAICGAFCTQRVFSPNNYTSAGAFSFARDSTPRARELLIAVLTIVSAYVGPPKKTTFSKMISKQK